MNASLLAPVVLFVYARAEHTQRTLAALSLNPEAKDTDLIIYADAARHHKDAAAVQAVRELINNIIGFKSVTLHLRETNVGLAENIIDGVTNVINKYGRVIVLEDDIITSPCFLKFMNDSLDLYKNFDKVISVSGCNYPVDLLEIPEETYFLRIPLCWGWATWSDRWSLFNKCAEEVPLIDNELVNYINFNGAGDYFKQAILNYKGKLNTWFIFWYVTSAKYKKLTLFPKFSLVENIGFDGSGENCQQSDTLFFSRAEKAKPVDVKLINFEENPLALELHENFLHRSKKSFFLKFIRRLKVFFNVTLNRKN